MDMIASLFTFWRTGSDDPMFQDRGEGRNPYRAISERYGIK